MSVLEGREPIKLEEFCSRLLTETPFIEELVSMYLHGEKPRTTLIYAFSRTTLALLTRTSCTLDLVLYVRGLCGSTMQAGTMVLEPNG